MTAINIQNNISRLKQASTIINAKLAEKFSKEDPSKTNKYLLWMASQKKKGHTDEDIIATVQSFDRRRKSLTHQDIYKYTELKTLEKELLKLNPSKAERRDLKNLRSGKDYVTLIDKGGIKLYLPLSFKGIKNLGKDTRWCIASSVGYWKSYSAENIIFVLLNDQLVKRKDNPLRKVAILKRHHNTYLSSYNANDYSSSIESICSTELMNDINDYFNLIGMIMTGTNSDNRPNPANIVFKYDIKEKKVENPLSMQDFVIQEIKNKKLFDLLPYSSNESLLLAMKGDIKKYFGQISFDERFSDKFINIFKDELKSDDFISMIKSKNMSDKKIKPFKDLIKKLNQDEFKKLLNETKFANTRKALLKLRPTDWKLLNKNKITAGLAYDLVVAHGEEALLLTCQHYNKYNTSYYRTYNKYTKYCL